MSSNLSKLSFMELEEDLNRTMFADIINHVMFVQQCNHSQLYIIENLQISLHFSLGSKSTEIFQKYLVYSRASFEIYSNMQSINEKSFVLMNNPSDILIQNLSYSNKMKQLAQAKKENCVKTDSPCSMLFFYYFKSF